VVKKHLVDPETKKYIDELVNSQSMKISAFLSSICQTLQDKHVITADDFNIILERSKIITTEINKMGKDNFAAFTQLKKDIEKSMNDLAKDKSGWSDLK